MKVLVYPHSLSLGGSQINAVEVAAAVQGLGHPTVIFGPPGPLVARIAELGLDFVPSPEPGRRPSPTVIRALRREIDRRKIDIVHGYEWPPALEGLAAAGGRPWVAGVATVMSMAVAPFLPRTMPLLVGTRQIAAVERRRGRSRVKTLEPPVDLAYNNCRALGDLQPFKEQWGLNDGKLNVVCVSRLSRQLKLEGVLAAVAAVDVLAGRLPVRLLIVGGGEGWDETVNAAARVNARHGEGTVILTGEMQDPRSAYGVADVAIGMGGSALRAMSFECPVIVQGENGFFRLLEPASLPLFQWQGWYGYGPTDQDGVGTLIGILEPLLSSSEQRAELGSFAHWTVAQNFSMTSAAERQLDFYREALSSAPGRVDQTRAIVRTAAGFAGYHARRRFRRLVGTVATDDYNALPLARTEAAMVRGEDCTKASIAKPALVYFSGQNWDAVVGTNRQMATALAQHRRIVWVDPPASWWYRRKHGIRIPRVSQARPGVTRLSTMVPVGVSRLGVRSAARKLAVWQAKRVMADLGLECAAVLVSSPDPVLADLRLGSSHRIYYATDDFVSGASLMGIPEGYLLQSRKLNLRWADTVLAVSEPLAHTLDDGHGSVKIFANGCNPAHYSDVDSLDIAEDVTLPRPIAGLIGQLNDRIDPALLEALADTGASLLLVGPRCATGAEMNLRLDNLIARKNVQWVGRQPYDRLPRYMAAIDVGLTPYVQSDFNSASFPLKTLEYVSAGRRVVSTDLPVARSIEPELITLASGPVEFAEAVCCLLRSPMSEPAAERCRQFAHRHSWQQRAGELDLLISSFEN